MALLHTPRPVKASERAFLDEIDALLGETTHLWAELNSDTLGSGDECDLLLADRTLGAFAIEVKSIVLDQILEMGPKTCVIEYPGSKQTRHPLDQAKSGMHSLRNYLEKKAEGTSKRHPYPFFKPVVAFPKIDVVGFEAEFSRSLQLIDQAKRTFLFAEHLRTTEAIREQLQRIYPDDKAPPTQSQIDFLVEHLSIDEAVSRRPRPTPADRERARLAMQQIAGAPTRRRDKSEETPRDRAYLGPDDPRLVLFTGAPGTGKTMELMRLALKHAKAEKRVLFTCYNLVLASFLDGLLASDEARDVQLAGIDIIPVGRLGRLIDADREAAANLYDTVCVDESQDLSQRAFDNIRHVVKDDGSWFLADGPGQELYNEGTPAPLLIRAREHAEKLGSVVKLNTSRRAATAALQIARSVRDVAPKKERLPAWYSGRAIQRPREQGQLELDPGAEPDPTELIDVRFWTSPPGPDRSFAALIRDLLAKLEQEDRAHDLAILVSRIHQGAENLHTARRVLDVMGVPYLDQTVEENKSIVLPEGQVRLVSYSSARGIEASRVLLLDLGAGFWDPKTKEQAETSRAMLYVALTRGRLGTTVLCGPDERSRPYVDFLLASVAEYERLMNLPKPEKRA